MGLASNALGCHPELYARDPDIGELRSLVIPPNQSHAPSLAQPCNLVLSLSKHAWNSRPALRQAQGEVGIVFTGMIGACGPGRAQYLTLGTRGAVDPGDKPRDDNCGGLA